MWLKIFCFGVIVSGVLTAKDELIQSMYGLEGGNKIEISVRTSRGWRCCDAALYRRDSVVARAGCIGLAPAANLTAVRVGHGGNCSTAEGPVGNMFMSRRYVYHVVMHPWFDLALLILHTPFFELEQHANITHMKNTLRPHGVYSWIKYYMKPSVQRSIFEQKQIVQPFWYTFVTILLPVLLYMLFYVYYMGILDTKSFFKKQQLSKKVPDD